MSVKTQTFINEIAKRANEQDWLSAMNVLRDGMRANINVRAVRGPDGMNQYETIPDHQVRLASAAMLIKTTQQMPSTKAELEMTEKSTPQEIARLCFKDVTNMLGIIEKIRDAQITQPIDVTPRKGQS
jgi:hypothetical protein